MALLTSWLTLQNARELLHVEDNANMIQIKTAFRIARKDMHGMQKFSRDGHRQREECHDKTTMSIVEAYRVLTGKKFSADGIHNVPPGVNPVQLDGADSAQCEVEKLRELQVTARQFFPILDQFESVGAQIFKAIEDTKNRYALNLKDERIGLCKKTAETILITVASAVSEYRTSAQQKRDLCVERDAAICKRDRLAQFRTDNANSIDRISRLVSDIGFCDKKGKKLQPIDIIEHLDHANTLQGDTIVVPTKWYQHIVPCKNKTDQSIKELEKAGHEILKNFHEQFNIDLREGRVRATDFMDTTATQHLDADINNFNNMINELDERVPKNLKVSDLARRVDSLSGLSSVNEPIIMESFTPQQKKLVLQILAHCNRRGGDYTTVGLYETIEATSPEAMSDFQKNMERKKEQRKIAKRIVNKWGHQASTIYTLSTMCHLRKLVSADIDAILKEGGERKLFSHLGPSSLYAFHINEAEAITKRSLPLTDETAKKAVAELSLLREEFPALEPPKRVNAAFN